MDVVIAGGHGQVALRLERLLDVAGHHTRALIRNPDHAKDIEATGAEPVLCDLEATEDLAEAVRGADAVVFAAGAGPGSGPARKQTVDLGAARKLIAAAEAAGTARYVMVSSIGAERPDAAGESMRPYLHAKAAADHALRASGLAWTIVRPGSLTDGCGTGRVRLTEELGGRGAVPRDDVAAVLALLLERGSGVGRTYELFTGDTPVDDAVPPAEPG